MPQRPSPPEELARWTEVDRYFGSRFGDSDPDLEAVLHASEAAGLPPVQVSPLQGKMLHLLAKAVRARWVLEIGSLAGYSTLWLARAVPPEGKVVTLEREPRHAELTRENLARAGLAERVDLRLGPALESLACLAEERGPPFDLVFIDADKQEYSEYLVRAVGLCRPGAVVIADNVVRRGDVADAGSSDPSVQGVRRMADRIAKEPSLSATVVQTVGVKGYDGFVLAVVNAPSPDGERAGGLSATSERRSF
jgi:predicted O-methyltransferase YrrM